jgi:hypothetical protein
MFNYDFKFKFQEQIFLNFIYLFCIPWFHEELKVSLKKSVEK